MRMWITLLVVASISLATMGCEEIANAASVKVPITVNVYPESINPTIPQTDVDSVDMSSNSDYNEYKDRIKDGTLKSAKFQIKEITGQQFDVNAVTFSVVTFNLTFDAKYNDNKVYQLGSFTNVPFMSIYNQQIDVPINNDVQSAISKIADGRSAFVIHAVYGPFTTGGPGTASYLKGHLALTIDFTAGI